MSLPGGLDAGLAPSAAQCQQIRARAQMILAANCAFCHQAPAVLGAPLTFILDFDALANAVSTSGAKYTVSGAPDMSRLYQRVAAGEMPPAGRVPRPSQTDIAALRDWIAGCPIAGAGAPLPPDAAAGSPVDGGGPPPGCGGPGQDCCLGSTCDAGGCCVQGQCRENGKACGDGVGQAGIAGVCHNGSCQNAGNVGCGSMNEPCCVDQPPTCTAPRTYCPMAGPMTCQACGAAGQPCCTNGGVTTCLMGLGCLDAGFGRMPTCQACGQMGQRCCGNGPITQRTCNGGLTCQPAGTADRCAL